MIKSIGGLLQYGVTDQGEVVYFATHQALEVTKEDKVDKVSICIGGFPTKVSVEVLYAWAYTEHPYTLDLLTKVRVSYKNKRKGLRADNVSLYIPDTKQLQKEQATRERMYRSNNKKRNSVYCSVPYSKLSHVAKQKRRKKRESNSTTVHGPNGTVDLNFDF